MLFSKKLKVCYYTESGRSMIEMLGVLAIVGVLSIAGIAGYRFASDKLHANEIVNDLNMRVIEISSQFALNEVFSRGVPLATTLGKVAGVYDIETRVTEVNSNYFTMNVSGIPSRICKQVLLTYGGYDQASRPDVIFVNEKPYDFVSDDPQFQNLGICDSSDFEVEEGSGTDVTMRFVYDNALTTNFPTCGRHASLDYGVFACKCPTGTFLDSTDNSCYCPALQVYSEKKGECIDSICAEGEFESLEKGCVPCDTSDIEDMDILDETAQIEVCEYCGRIYDPNLKKCIKGCPDDGQTYMINNDGYCTSCASPAQKITNVSESECLKCSNRMYFPSIGCALIQDTSGNKVYMKTDKTFAKCSDIVTLVGIYNSDESKALCRACGEDYEVSGSGSSWWYCRKKTCPSDYFKDSNGYCRPCNDSLSRGTSLAECEKCTNRMPMNCNAANTYCSCALTCMDTQFMGINGSCYSCAQSSRAYIGTSLAVQESCNGCSADTPRIYVDGYCYKKCPEGYFYDSDGNCQSCSDGASHIVGSLSVSQQTCAACSSVKRKVVHAMGDYQCVLDSCPSDKPIRTAYGSCLACNYSSSVDIRSFVGENDLAERCIACGRDVVGNMCYLSCDPETFRDSEGQCHPCSDLTAYFVGTDSALHDSCENCGNRRVTGDNYCALNCEDSGVPTFETGSGTCVACSVQGGVEIGTGVLERNSCLACGNRFWNGSKCYPCLWNEELETQDELDADSCESCSTRVIDHETGKCRLTNQGNDFDY